MKLILSRKGFDSTAGGVASPIFPGGEMYSLPIQADGAACNISRFARGAWRTGPTWGRSWNS